MARTYQAPEQPAPPPELAQNDGNESPRCEDSGVPTPPLQARDVVLSERTIKEVFELSINRLDLTQRIQVWFWLVPTNHPCPKEGTRNGRPTSKGHERIVDWSCLAISLNAGCRFIRVTIRNSLQGPCPIIHKY